MAISVRVEDEFHALLAALAAEEGRPIGRIIEDAIGQYRRERFWRGVHVDYQRLKADPVAWPDYQDELRLLEGGSMDGLEANEPSYPADEETGRGPRGENI